MNPNAAEATIHRKAVLLRRTIPPCSESPPPEGGTVSHLHRWLRAIVLALKPTPVSSRPAAPAERTADAPGAASIDSRELSSWRPFSPRF
jgi:hypothetical protein